MSTSKANRAVDLDELRARRISDSLTKLLAEGDAANVIDYMISVLGPSPTDPQKARFSSKALRRMVELYDGGLVQLTQDFRKLEKSLASKGGHLKILAVEIVVKALLQRLSDETLDAGLQAALQQLETTGYAEESFAELSSDFLNAPGSQLYELIEEMLGEAKGFYAKQSDDLSDGGHDTLAALLATASDIFVPGTPLDVALTLLPVGRLACLTKILLVRAAGRLAENAFFRLGAQLLQMLKEAAAAQALSSFKEPFTSLSIRAVDELAQLAARNTDRIDEIIEVINRNLEKFTPQPVRRFEERIRARLMGAADTKDDVLDVLLKKPTSGLVGIDYVITEGGRVIQRIRTALYRRAGERGSKASVKAESAGLAATLEPNRRDWGHLVPDVLGGADEVWNFVLMSRRFNRSVFGKIDRLLDDTPELEGLTVMVYAEFETVEMAQKRIASRIVWELPAAGTMDPRFIVLGNPLNEPTVTFRVFRKSLEAFARRLRRSVE